MADRAAPALDQRAVGPCVDRGDRRGALPPDQARARTVLAAIGSGERTSAIASATGGLGGTSLARALALLQGKRVVDAATPYPPRPAESAGAPSPTPTCVPRFVAPGLDEVDRGRGDVVLERVRRDWLSWRGRAVEPLVRDALERLLPDDRFPGVRHVGGWWNR